MNTALVPTDYAIIFISWLWAVQDQNNPIRKSLRSLSFLDHSLSILVDSHLQPFRVAGISRLLCLGDGGGAAGVFVRRHGKDPLLFLLKQTLLCSLIWISLCRAVWPGTPRDLPYSASWVLELKLCATMSSLKHGFM